MYAHELYEQNKPKIVVTYPGRFQPFHRGHAGVFAQLQKKFGRDSVYILTSNDTNSAKSPFNFSDKYQLMTAAGVPGDKIIETNQMYKLPDSIDAANTIFITAVGAPDADRLNPDTYTKRDQKDKEGNITKPAGSPSYYKTWGGPETPVTADQHGYVIVIPEIHKEITIKGQKYDVSHGTECRNLWNSIRNDAKARTEFLSQMYARPSQELAAIFDKIPQATAEDISADSQTSTSPIHGTEFKQGVAESQTAKTGIMQTDVYGSRAYHARCLEPGCDWESRRYDRIQQAQAAAKKHAETHFDKKAVAEGLDEAVGGNYLYHATSADGLKGMLSSGSIRSATGPQAATQAQTKLPTVSVTRDWGYASGTHAQSQMSGIGRDAILVLDRNAVESNFKTLGTSQNTNIRGLAFNPYLRKDGEARPQNTDPMARANAKAKAKYAEPTAKAGGEFEEAVVVPKGALPLKGTMVGFWVNPSSELMKDPAIINDPRRLDMVRPNQFIQAKQAQGVAEGATVTRIDSKPITDFMSSLKAYKHTDDWSQSGLDTGDDSYWKNKNLKTNTTKGLFAGDPRRTALYATGNAHETRYVEFTQNGQPIVYFDQKDLPAMRSRKTYLTVFDASNFRQLPTGEWFSENPGKPIKQVPIGDPFKYIASQGWIVRVTDDLDKVFKQVQKMHKAGKIPYYGAEGMNESKQSVAEDAAGVGVVAKNKKMVRDPRYSMSITKDVKPSTPKNMLRAFRLSEDSSVSEEQIMSMVKNFLPLAMKELKIKKLPKIIIKKHIETTDGQATFGRFVNEEEKIYLGIADRHPVDILRTLAHELVHFKQYEQGRMEPDSGDTGSPIENEANAVAGVLMRYFNKKYPDAVKSSAVSLDESLFERYQQFKENGDEADEIKKQKNLIPFPKGTVKVDVSDVYDWYKIGQEISDLDDADPADFGKGPPQTVMAFGSEPEEHRYLKDLKRLGLKTHDIDENFADGRNPQDKGDSKRYNVPTKGKISTLRKIAKQGGRRGQLAHWMANMRSGKNKK